MAGIMKLKKSLCDQRLRGKTEDNSLIFTSAPNYPPSYSSSFPTSSSSSSSRVYNEKKVHPSHTYPGGEELMRQIEESRNKIPKKRRKERETIADPDEEDDAPIAWLPPLDLTNKNKVMDAPTILNTIKQKGVVWDNSTTVLGAESDDNFLLWLRMYSGYICEDKRKADNADII